MSYDESDREAHKTGRIVTLSLLVFSLGAFFFAYKVEACKTTPEKCHEEFFELQNNNANQHTCSPGAVVEIVQSPKQGIICHCAPGTSATSK